MGCSGCGNNGPTPIVGNLDDGAVVLEYTGERTAPVTYTANGSQYQAGRDRVNAFIRVRPGDAPVLLNTGHFRQAPTWEPSISIILPTRGRPEILRRCLESLVATAPSVQIVAVVDAGDNETLAVLRDFDGSLPISSIESKAGATASEKWNLGAGWTPANTLVFAADDLVFHPEWIEKTTKALKAFPDGSALVGFDELARSPHPLHFAVTRKLLDEINGGLLVVPHYRSWYMDTELCDKARAWGRYIANCGAVVEHKHPMHGTAPIDDLHRSGFLLNQHRDRFIYENRKRAGYPTDWPQGATAATWLVGYVPPAADRTEQVLNARMGLATATAGAMGVATTAATIPVATTEFVAPIVEPMLEKKPAKKVAKRAPKAVPA